MRAGIYIRVSTNMQVEEGFSLDGQRTRLINFAKSQDWGIHDFYVDEGKSAKDLKRPDMERMLKDMQEHKFDVVLVYKLDRLTRSVGDLHQLLKEFEKYDVKFKSATEVFDTTTAMGKLFITIVAALAEWERGTISERVRFGIEQMILEGKRPGGILPYGYNKNEQVIQEEAEIIKEARSLYLSGMGYKSVAMKLNREDKLRRGHEWTSATVSYTLENPYYAGILRLGTKLPGGEYVNHKRDERVKCLYGDGDHEPIFTRLEYEELKAFMTRKSNSGFSRVQTYWFSGVLRCGRCGGSMFGRLSNKRKLSNGEIVRTPYYICSNKHSNKSCDMPMFRQIHVEHLVMQYIKQIKIDHDAINEINASVEKELDNRDDKVEVAKKELKRIQERREKWQYMFVEGLISKDQIRKRIQEEDDSEAKVRKIIGENEGAVSTIPKMDGLIELEQLWAIMNDEDRKEMIYTTFKKIELNTDETNVKGVRNRFFDAYLGEVLYN
ncbi:recombinase family protein [Paenibacillus sp. NRS-1782]|uniref:recombinase family protein n=1 Tax=unclassified Paenibacillus TaxID=185978 RepID=UPI003D26636A